MRSEARPGITSGANGGDSSGSLYGQRTARGRPAREASARSLEASTGTSVLASRASIAWRRVSSRWRIHFAILASEGCERAGMLVESEGRRRRMKQGSFMADEDGSGYEPDGGYNPYGVYDRVGGRAQVGEYNPVGGYGPLGGYDRDGGYAPDGEYARDGGYA